MHVRLISEDRDLYTLCREILIDLPDHDWNLSTGRAEASSTADFHIWDYQPGMEVPQNTWRVSKHLFLVARKDVEEWRQAIGAPEANILLKPVTRATLAAFLGLAVAAHEDQMSAATSRCTDLDEILQCLIQTNLKLQEYDQDRTNFLARAVHDFRAPLTAVNGYCGLLLSEAPGALNNEQQQILRRMQHSVKRLSRMASAMFQLSVGRHVKKRPNLRKGDIREPLEQALHEISPLTEDKRLSISVDLDAEPVLLFFESGQLEQVFINLLDNACKFTPRAGEIEIRGYPYFWDRRTLRAPSITPTGERRNRMSREPNSYRLDLRNSGSPIPSEHFDYIFEEYSFYSGSHDRSGGGLGLAICRMIIAQHEGRIWAENTDRGPMFSLVLPFELGECQETETSASDSKHVEVL